MLGRATGTIGAVLPHITGEFFADLLSGLDAAIQRHGYLLMVSASRRLEDDYIAALEGMYRRVDGLIVMAPELTADRVLSLMGPTVPIVFLNTETTTPGIHSVHFDNRGGMEKIAQHIADLGHTLVAYIGGPKDAFDAQERQRGFLEAAPDGLKVVYFAGNYTFEYGYDCTKKILQLSPRPTVIVAANDLSALGVLRALHENGIKIPDEIAVTGFDGIQSAHFSNPSLTTVNVPIGQLAANAVQILVNQISNEPTSQIPEQSNEMELVVRESSIPSFR